MSVVWNGGCGVEWWGIVSVVWNGAIKQKLHVTINKMKLFS